MAEVKQSSDTGGSKKGGGRVAKATTRPSGKDSTARNAARGKGTPRRSPGARIPYSGAPPSNRLFPGRETESQALETAKRKISGKMGLGKERSTRVEGPIRNVTKRVRTPKIGRVTRVKPKGPIKGV